ncbi:hypothetical protein [Muricoccus radiodurans]|uniref:hypothetical protein n=1 Tax=Muricoccus radiodurans TaxID=2231721 RepID=UPI003CF38DDB
MSRTGNKSATPRTVRATPGAADRRAGAPPESLSSARAGANLRVLVDRLERRSVEAVQRADQLLRNLG